MNGILLNKNINNIYKISSINIKISSIINENLFAMNIYLNSNDKINVYN